MCLDGSREAQALASSRRLPRISPPWGHRLDAVVDLVVDRHQDAEADHGDSKAFHHESLGPRIVLTAMLSSAAHVSLTELTESFSKLIVCAQAHTYERFRGEIPAI